jgi:uncharacterized protein (TIRG00374 family)
MRTLRLLILPVAVLAVIALVYHLGADSITAALAHVTWWQFVLICVIHAANVAVDAYGWRYAFARDGVPFRKLMLARCAGDAVNTLTAVAAVGGEALKAWLLRREVSYEESVPSLIVSKTAETVGQALLLALGLLLVVSTEAVGPGLRTAMISLMLVEVIGVGGLVGVQLAGLVGRAGRIVAWFGVDATHVERLDEALRGFYRREWRRFLVSVGFYFLGWLLGAVQGLLILHSLGLSASLVTATIMEALWSAVRFATFYVPASLGTLEGATAAAFAAFGFTAGAGLAFTLVRRASQAVWIAIGVLVLVAMRPSGLPAGERVAPVPSAAE